jgi:subtilisin family serine protease
MTDPDERRNPPFERDPNLQVPPALLGRYNARVLDPSTAVQVPGQPQAMPTVYLADRLLVHGVADTVARDALTEAAAQHGLALQPPLLHEERSRQRAELARRAGVDGPSVHDSIAVNLVPTGTGPVEAPDAWRVLQTYRGNVGRAGAAGRQVALDHLISATRHTQGSPFPPRASAAPMPMDSYGTPGFGGRGPVQWMGARPHRSAEFSGRRPVVAVLDTGVGKHPWFDAVPGLITRDPHCRGTAIGFQDAATDPEATGVITDPLEGVLDSDSGHGTFIAGLIHQMCPDANILSARVMPSDGAVPEHVLLDALNLLALRQQLAQQEGREEEIIDILSLSLGYYHEQPEDVTFDPLLLHPLRALAQSGVIIVAAAGNDATTRPMFPAAFTTFPGALGQDRAPIVSVGARNPDGTIALFSNGGDWVTCFRPGAGLVSTFPVTFDGSGQPAFRVEAADGTRAAYDPDNFSCGFGTWSGTSFAAPILAGEIAAAMAGTSCLPVDAAAMIKRSWDAAGMTLNLEPR